MVKNSDDLKEYEELLSKSPVPDINKNNTENDVDKYFKLPVCPRCNKKMTPLNWYDSHTGKYYLLWSCGCKSTLDMEEDKRQKRWQMEKKEFGFDERTLWDLQSDIATYIIPRLKAFREATGMQTPEELCSQSWNLILSKMITAFELICQDNVVHDFSQETDQNIKEGLNLFAEYFEELWC